MHLTSKRRNSRSPGRTGCSLLEGISCRAQNDPTGHEADFLRGEFTGWRSTLHTEYHDCAEEIVDRVLTQTGLPIPEGEIGAVSLVPLEGRCPSTLLDLELIPRAPRIGASLSVQHIPWI